MRALTARFTVGCALYAAAAHGACYEPPSPGALPPEHPQVKLAAPGCRGTTGPKCDGPVLPSSVSPPPPAPPRITDPEPVPPWGTYQPLYQPQFDRERCNADLSQHPLYVFEKDFFSIGIDITYARVGRPLHFSGAGGGLLGLEASWVPFVSESFLWIGVFGEGSYDFQYRQFRAAPGLEFGYAFLSLDAAPLFNFHTQQVGVQGRFMLALPVHHSDVRYSAACCTPERAGGRSCACDGSLTLYEVEPYVRVEYQPSGVEPETQVFGGIVVKWGRGY